MARLPQQLRAQMRLNQYHIQAARSGIPRSRSADYQLWLLRHFPDRSRRRQLAQQINQLTYQPTLSIIMPVYNPSPTHLREAIESVLQQIYPHWELCIADDASSVAEIRPLLEQYAAQDARIKLVLRSENGHISRASNSALAVASGEFIALLDHDDQLTPQALYEVVSLLNRHPEADMVYSDEDKLDARGYLQEPFFKPDWCPDSFLSRMYTCHLGVYRKSLVDQIGGFRPGYEGAQDYDLVLRLTEQTQRIYHLPQVLYHWRCHEASTATGLKAKDYAAAAAQAAITEALQRRGEPGRVEAAPGENLIVRYEILRRDRVSIIIPTRDLGAVVDCCLTSIFEKSTYDNFEVLLIDNGSTEPETLQIIEAWKQKAADRFRCIPYQVPFNYAQINNYATQFATGDYLLFLNNDIEVMTPDWLEAMIEQGQRPSIGAVGAMLLYPNDTIQHAGVIAGIGGIAGHSHKCFAATASGYFNQIQTVNNYSAVTAACLLCRRSVFEEVNGFDEALAIAFNDVDLCFKMVSRGYRNVYLPHVRLYHYESRSRGYEVTPEKRARFEREADRLRQKWPDLIAHDPCYSPHLSRHAENFSLNLD
jgi:glycosyltransferase involved in cell wall biosynthesis